MNGEQASPTDGLRRSSLVSIGVAWTCGLVIGAADSTLFGSVRYGSLLLACRYMVVSAVFQGLFAVAAGLPVWMLVHWWTRRASSGERIFKQHISVILAAILAVILLKCVYYYQTVVLSYESALSPRGLAVTGLWGLAVVAVGIGLLYLLARIFSRRVHGVIQYCRLLALTGGVLAIPAILCTIVLLGGYGRSVKGPSRDRNLLIVLIDSLRDDVLSEYLESGYASDGLKRLVNRGCRYPGAYATFSQSLPSHASLFTGRYPYETGAMLSIAADGSDVGSSLRPDCDTLAEVLGRNGYESIAILHNPWLGPPFGLEAGYQTFVNIKKPERIGSFIPALVPDVCTLGKYLEYLQSEFIRRSEHPHVRLFRSWFESRDRSRPFFLFLHFIDLHWPNDPPKQYREKFCKGEFADLVGSELDAKINKKEFSEAQMPAVRRQLRALNLAFFAQIDDWLQPVFETLENEGVFDDTMVVFTSDHGDNLHENEQGYGHSHVYQVAIKVPLVICAPGRGSRAEHPGLVSLIDVAPTAYAFTGVAPPSGLPGIDLLARQGDVIAPERSIFVMGVDVTHPGEHVFAELKDSFKCVSSESAGVQLYDLSADPGEEHDLAGEMPDRANEMKLTLDRYISLTTAASRELMNPEDLSSDTAADLRKLKYLK